MDSSATVMLVCAGRHPTHWGRGGLKNRNAFSHGSGGYEFESKLLAGLVSGEVSLVGPQVGVFLVFTRLAPFTSVVCVLISPSYKYLSHTGSGLIAVPL